MTYCEILTAEVLPYYKQSVGMDICVCFRWRSSFLVSLIFGVPVMALMMYFHWFKGTHHGHHQIMLFCGVSLDNLLFLMLCTPVQVYKLNLSRKSCCQQLLVICKKGRFSFFSLLVVVTFMFSLSKPSGITLQIWMSLLCWQQL